MRDLKAFKVLLRLPEMQIFWISLPLLLVLTGLGLYYLPASIFVITLALAVGLMALLFLLAYRAAVINYRSKVEHGELKNIIKSLEDALVVYDRGFKILYFNHAAERLFGVKTEEAVGKEIQPRDAENLKLRLLTQVMFPSLAPGVIIRSKPGEYPQVADVSFTEPRRELRVFTSAVNDESGLLLGFMKLIRDRTREIELVRSKNEFITVASHQLRTPISEVQWALETLAQEPNLEPEKKTMLQGTLISARKLLNIVEDLLSVSKIEEGRFGYNFESADMVEYLNGLLAQVLPQVRRAGLKLYFDRPRESLPKVTIDPQKLSIVMSNLLDNAIRYNVEHGNVVVRVRVSEEGPFIEASVRDTGIGIPPEDINKIFEKFFRAANALKFKTEGSGLGLYIAKNIIQAHGGRMWAVSELNRGTTFFFTLPTDPALVPPKEVPLEY